MSRSSDLSHIRSSSMGMLTTDGAEPVYAGESRYHNVASASHMGITSSSMASVSDNLGINAIHHPLVAGSRNSPSVYPSSSVYDYRPPTNPSGSTNLVVEHDEINNFYSYKAQLLSHNQNQNQTHGRPSQSISNPYYEADSAWSSNHPPRAVPSSSVPHYAEAAPTKNDWPPSTAYGYPEQPLMHGSAYSGSSSRTAVFQGLPLAAATAASSSSSLASPSTPYQRAWIPHSTSSSPATKKPISGSIAKKRKTSGLDQGGGPSSFVDAQQGVARGPTSSTEPNTKRMKTNPSIRKCPYRCGKIYSIVTEEDENNFIIHLQHCVNPSGVFRQDLGQLAPATKERPVIHSHSHPSSHPSSHPASHPSSHSHSQMTHHTNATLKSKTTPVNPKPYHRVTYAHAGHFQMPLQKSPQVVPKHRSRPHSLANAKRVVMQALPVYAASSATATHRETVKPRKSSKLQVAKRKNTERGSSSDSYPLFRGKVWCPYGCPISYRKSSGTKSIENHMKRCIYKAKYESRRKEKRGSKHQKRKSSKTTGANSSGGAPTSDNNRDEIRCSVCGVDEGEQGNAIILCDHCDMAVHQGCYGVKEIPENDWFCDPCAEYRRRFGTGISKDLGSGSVSCVICPAKGGALKPARFKGHRSTSSSSDASSSTKKIDFWCHVTCTLWHPQLVFQDAVHFKDAVGFESISDASLMSRCYLCMQNKRDDVKCSEAQRRRYVSGCVKCSTKSCMKMFHPQCARTDPTCYMDFEFNQKTQSVRMALRCDAHHPKRNRIAKQGPKRILRLKIDKEWMKEHQFSTSSSVALSMLIKNKDLQFGICPCKNVLCFPSKAQFFTCAHCHRVNQVQETRQDLIRKELDSHMDMVQNVISKQMKAQWCELCGQLLAFEKDDLPTVECPVCSCLQKKHHFVDLNAIEKSGIVTTPQLFPDNNTSPSTIQSSNVIAGTHRQSNNETNKEEELAVESTTVMSKVEPVPSTTTQPVPSTTTQPVSSTTTQPVPSTTTQPVPSTTTQPVPSTTTQPVPSTTTQPVPSTTTQPVPSTTTQPVPSTTTQPVPSTTTQPVSNSVGVNRDELVSGESTNVSSADADVVLIDGGDLTQG